MFFPPSGVQRVLDAWGQLLSRCPPLILDARGRQLLFSYFLCIYPYFLTFTYTFLENFFIGCPAWMPGAVAPSAPASARH